MKPITDVSPEVFDRLRAQLEDRHGATITVLTPTQGEIRAHGIELHYDYDGHRQWLMCEIHKHPFHVPESTIEAQLRSTIQQIRMAVKAAQEPAKPARGLAPASGL
jgi:Mg-chelatase subunit ChlI